MIELREISSDVIHQFITLAYLEDYELFKEFHIQEFGTCLEAVECEYNRIAEASKHVSLKYYSIIYRGMAIGYMVTFLNVLYSFAVNIRFRLKEILTEWMYAVRSLFNNNFVCYLYNRNARAIGFMLKNDMQISHVDMENEFVTLINKYSSQS